MSQVNRDILEQRVLILEPSSIDADLTHSMLEEARVCCAVCGDPDELCGQLEAGAGAVLLAEDAVAVAASSGLTNWLRRQPTWSDLPVMILAAPGADGAAIAQARDLLGNVTVLERPVRPTVLVHAVRSALRARRQQYQTREHLAQIERGEKDRYEAYTTQAKLAAIVESSDDAIISKTLTGDILTWNGGAERLFGYTAAEAVGRPITMLIPPERQEEEPKLLERLRRGERIEHFETVRVTKDGRRLDISLTVSPVRAPDGTIIGASKVARDISDRKRAETALREADRRKDEFLAVLAHELRNPLAPICNSIHILRMTSLQDATAERVLEMMERQVNHMVRLVDDLMEVSRITRGKIALRKEPVELAAILRSAVETSRPLLDAAGHQLALALPSEPLTLKGDAVRLAQVFANLLNNAAKYTEKGGQIWLTVRQVEGWVTVSVRDTGMGIPPEMLPRVFDLFTQVERHAGRAQGGLGIGLTLVRSLVEMHGGTVRAHSAGPGQGSEFVVRLPAAASPRPVALPDAPVMPSAVLALRRVLVVDDNRDAAHSIGTLLQLLGADVQIVYSGAAALEALHTYKPAVILLDIGMPDMDGHEVARRIRGNPEFRDVTLIALSGWGQEDDRRRSQEAGFDYHLIKPADLGALQSLLVSLDAK